MYGIRINSPTNGDQVPSQFIVKGVYDNEPPAGSILLLLKSPSGDFFPQDKVTVDSGARAWQGSINLGDYSGNKFVVIVAIMGKNGQALYDYFNKVGTETKRWPAIKELTDDIAECDRVSIVH